MSAKEDRAIELLDNLVNRWGATPSRVARDRVRQAVAILNGNDLDVEDATEEEAKFHAGSEQSQVDPVDD